MSKKPDTNYFQKKIFKANNAAITPIEESVARALAELEVKEDDYLMFNRDDSSKFE
jgi:hypothetical protein